MNHLRELRPQTSAKMFTREGGKVLKLSSVWIVISVDKSPNWFHSSSIQPSLCATLHRKHLVRHTMGDFWGDEKRACSLVVVKNDHSSLGWGWRSFPTRRQRFPGRSQTVMGGPRACFWHQNRKLFLFRVLDQKVHFYPPWNATMSNFLRFFPTSHLFNPFPNQSPHSNASQLAPLSSKNESFSGTKIAHTEKKTPNNHLGNPTYCPKTFKITLTRISTFPCIPNYRDNSKKWQSVSGSMPKHAWQGNERPDFGRGQRHWYVYVQIWALNCEMRWEKSSAGRRRWGRGELRAVPTTPPPKKQAGAFERHPSRHHHLWE